MVNICLLRRLVIAVFVRGVSVGGVVGDQAWDAESAAISEESSRRMGQN